MTYDEEESALPYSTIGTDDARRMIEAGARIIDVRRPDEWNRGHIAEAELSDHRQYLRLGKALKDLNLSPDEDTIFVCASGQRSAMACEIAC